MPTRDRQTTAAIAGSEVTCPICAFVFDPGANASCPTCPLNSGCTLVCCPNCGHDTVDPTRSTAVQLGARIGRLLRGGSRREPKHAVARTLAEVSPGERAIVAGLDGLEHHHREHLQAYGLVPGRPVHVIQHAPVTVVQVEHTEVAFEFPLARGIAVETPADAPATADRPSQR